jgi:CRP-like cAMP-binding protein
MSQNSKNLEFIFNKNITSISSRYNYSKDSLIYSENETCTNLVFVNSGEVHIINSSNNTNNNIITIIKENNFFGINLIYADNKKYLGDIVTSTDSVLTFIPCTLLKEAIKKDPDLLDLFLTILCNNSLQTTQKLKLLTQKSILDRLVFHFKIHNIDGILKIKSIQKLAETLNVDRQSIYRAIKYLNDNKILNYSNKTFSNII